MIFSSARLCQLFARGLTTANGMLAVSPSFVFLAIVVIAIVGVPAVVVIPISPGAPQWWGKNNCGVPTFRVERRTVRILVSGSGNRAPATVPLSSRVSVGSKSLLRQGLLVHCGL